MSHKNLYALPVCFDWSETLIIRSSSLNRLVFEILRSKIAKNHKSYFVSHVRGTFRHFTFTHYGHALAILHLDLFVSFSNPFRGFIREISRLRSRSPCLSNKTLDFYIFFYHNDNQISLSNAEENFHLTGFLC